jgi:tetratricopeptide (TPR) repeat protein
MLALAFAGACSSLHVGRDVQARRQALQIGQPETALGYLSRAAAQEPAYTLPYRLGSNVLTLLGRAYYETGRDEEARATLEKALSVNSGDSVARLYLGLTLLRAGEQARAEKEIQSGLRGVYDALENYAADALSGPYWDPARQIRGDIERAMAIQPDSAELVGLVASIGKSIDEETDRARRDEGRSLYERRGDS